MSQHWDEIASAYLDGEATPQEMARLEADAEGQAALAELRRVAEANAVVPPPPPTLAARHLGAALDLFDELAGSAPSESPASASRPSPRRAPSSSTPSNVVPLERRRTTAWLGAVAAGIVVVAGIGLGVSRLGGPSDGSETADAASSPSANAEMLGSDAATETTQAAAAMAATEAEGVASDERTTGDDAAMEEASSDEAAADAGESAPTTTTAQTTEPSAGTPVPLAELTASDDLFAVSDLLIADDSMTADPTTDIGRQLEAIQVRCPSAFGNFGQPIAAPVLFDGSAATLVVDSPQATHAMVITRECTILSADQRP